MRLHHDSKSMNTQIHTDWDSFTYSLETLQRNGTEKHSAWQSNRLQGVHTIERSNASTNNLHDSNLVGICMFLSKILSGILRG